jgi:hypothetical protein
MTNELAKKTSKWKSLREGGILAIIYFTTGFSFFLAEITFHGWTLFVVLPFIVGLSASVLPNKKYGTYGIYAGLTAFCISLLLGRWEGVICLIYASPLTIGAIILGLLISDIIK